MSRTRTKETKGRDKIWSQEDFSREMQKYGMNGEGTIGDRALKGKRSEREDRRTKDEGRRH